MKKRLMGTAAVTLSIMLLWGCTGSTDSSNTVNTTDTESTQDASSDNDNAVGALLSDEATRLTEDLELPVEGFGFNITTDIKANEPYKIGLIIKNTTNPYMLLQADGAAKAAEDMGFEISVQAPAQADSAEEQLSIMDSMVQGGTEAFVVHVVDSKGIVPAVNRAIDKGIPIAAVGTAPETDIFLRTGADYYPSGKAVAEKLFEMAGGTGGLVILEGTAGAQNAEERKQGIMDVLENYPDIELLASQPANFNRVQGMQVMENILQREGIREELTMVIGCNSEMAMGALQAIKAAGLQDQVMVASFDCFRDDATAVQNGEMAVTYNMDPYSATYLACAYLVQYLNDGTEPPYPVIPFPAERDDPLITSENIDDFMENRIFWE